MDDEEVKEFAQIMQDLQDLVHLVAVLDGLIDRLSQEANEILLHIKEENGEDIGFDDTS